MWRGLFGVRWLATALTRRGLPRSGTHGGRQLGSKLPDRKREQAPALYIATLKPTCVDMLRHAVDASERSVQPLERKFIECVAS